MTAIYVPNYGIYTEFELKVDRHEVEWYGFQYEGKQLYAKANECGVLNFLPAYGNYLDRYTLKIRKNGHLCTFMALTVDECVQMFIDAQNLTDNPPVLDPDNDAN